MKTKQFTLPNGEYLAIEVPENSTRHFLRYEDRYKSWSIDYTLPSGPGYTSSGSKVLLVKDFGGRKNYPKENELKLIGCTATMSERDWSNVVPGAANMFVDYMSPSSFRDYSKSTAKEAGESLMQSLGLDNAIIIEILRNG
jgi:hypothetical protein